MESIIFNIAIILIAYIIIQIVMDLKAKNFIPETHYVIVSIVPYCVVIFNRSGIKSFHEIINDSYILLIILVVILGVFILLRKNKFYHLRRIDKKFIEEKENDISDIINQFKNSLEDESDITLVDNRIVFENVSKAQVQECLLLIGNYLDKNRKKYTYKDYMHCYTKSIILPIIITIAVIYILVKAFIHIG